MPSLDAIGVIVSDMGRAIEFYRLVGLEFAEGADEVHAEATGPGGIRVMLDTEASVMSFSDWQPPTGGGPAPLWLSSATPSPTSTGSIRIW